MEQAISLARRSESTLKNYSHHVAKMALHFGKTPTTLDEDQVNDYLHLVQQRHPTASESYFKFTVYGLRFLFRVHGLKELRIALPVIRSDKRLPVVLSQEETRRMLTAPTILKHRVLLGLLYGCGLRCFEVRGIRLGDIDLERKMLHVRQGKGKKDRYVPLGDMLVRGLKSYIASESPEEWLFNGRPEGRAGGDFDGRYSQRGVQWAVREACKKAGVKKAVTVHTLRHSYATHLLEMGLDIISIKELLGHECIETTMVYLHVAKCGRAAPFSPLDRLYAGKG